MGFSRQEYWSGLPFPSPVDHKTSPPWPICLGWPHTAWRNFIDKAVVRVIRLTSFLWLWFQCVCPLMPSCNTYCFTWFSLTLDVEHLFTAAPAKRNHCSLPLMWGCSSWPPPLPILNTHWKDWCWSSNSLSPWYEELTHWKRLWCWKDWRQEEKGMTEDEMVGWHHRLNGHEFQ